jgi:hypothetical protein
LDGEICYAVDQDQYYQNEGGTLVAVGATKAQGILADSATQPGDNISTLTNDSGYITSAGAPVQSVAGKTGVVTLVKGDVGLGNVDNTSDLNKPISTATQTALDLKAPLASPALTGVPTAPTATVGTNTTQLATTAFVVAEVAAGGGGGAVDSVNGQTGTVVLDPDDLDDSATTNKFATAAELGLIGTATQPGDNISTLTNDSGYITDDAANTFTQLQAFNAGVDVDGPYKQTVEAVAALDIDCSTGNYFTKTISGDSTFTVSNVPASRAYSFTLELTHTSGVVTWFSGVEWPGGAAPTLTTGKTHLFVFVTDDGGTRWRGAALANYTN